MLDPELIEKLKQAGYPLIKDPVDLHRIPPQTYREPTVGDLLFELGEDCEGLINQGDLGDKKWRAYRAKGEKDGFGNKPLVALIKLYIAIKKI